MYSCGGNGNTTLGFAIIAFSVLLAIVLGAGQPAAAAVTDPCATCNGDCVARCRGLAPVACKLECEKGTTACEACEAKSIKTCSAACYDDMCKRRQGCRDDEATLCRACRIACVSSGFSHAENACAGECGRELCLRCAAAGGAAETVRCDDTCVASSSDRFSSCPNDLACSSGGNSASSKCVRCPTGSGFCNRCKSREQDRLYKACLDSDCVQGSGCAPSLLQGPLF